MMSREKACEGKKRLTKAEAKKRERRRSAGALRAGDRPWTAYRCPHCDFWHVGHMPRAVRQDRFYAFGRKARR